MSTGTTLRTRGRATAALVPLRRSGLLAAAVVLLAACGGGSDDAGSADDSSDPRQGPLGQLLGIDVSSAEQRAKELEVQQEIVQCMQDEGWEYQAVDWQAQMGDMAADFEEQMSDPEGYGEKYGYGVVRSYESQGAMSVPGDGGFEDPNADYVASLTESETRDYYEALYGPTPDVADGEEFMMPPLEEQGCTGVAQLAVFGENPITDPDVQARVGELFEDVENDPDLVDAYETWSACMRERDPSYEWDRPDDVSSEFWNRLSELQGFDGGELGVTESEGDGTMMMPEGDGTMMMPEVDEADLEELRADEVATWRDDWACQQEADLVTVRREIEQRIADDLLAEFPELGDE